MGYSNVTSLDVIRTCFCINFTEYTPADCKLVYEFLGASTIVNDTSDYFIQMFLLHRVDIIICCIGIIGNIINLIILTIQIRYMTNGRMQKFACTGLIALAISDLGFCISVLPYVHVTSDDFVNEINFSLLYSTYSQFFINWFVMSSTWIATILSLGRYIAVCHPFRARELIGSSMARRCVYVVYLSCAGANVPRFFWKTVEYIECSTDKRWYFQWIGPLHGYRNPIAEIAYSCSYFVVAVFAPTAILVCTSCTLARKLDAARKSRLVLLRRNSETNESETRNRSDRMLTLTLILVAVFHVTMVSPSEILTFSRQLGALGDKYSLLLAFFNTLQAVNFSINFLLYCVMNAIFRSIIYSVIRCRKVKLQQRLSITNVNSIHLV